MFKMFITKKKTNYKK